MTPNTLCEDVRPCIMMVDDDELTLAILSSGVQRAGYDALPAGSPEAALQLVAQRNPDLAILDIEMPGMTGIELARRLRFGNAVPFIFLTSRDDDVTVGRAVELGAVGYLVKPVDIRQIVPAIKAGLSRAADIARLQRAEAELSVDLQQLHDQRIQADQPPASDRFAVGSAHATDDPFSDISPVDDRSDWPRLDLRQCLDSTLNLIFRQVHCELDVIRDYGEVDAVSCLPDQIGQVFMYLLRNAVAAIDASEHRRRGRILLRTGSDGRRVWAEIADNGAGIAPEDLQRLFQARINTLPPGTRAGMGLSLSRDIIENHGVEISVRSRVGEGSVFRVSLPLRSGAP